MFKKCASVSLLFFRELDIKAASGNQIDLMVIFYDCILKLLFICGISHVMTFNLSKKPYQKTLKWTGSTQSFFKFYTLALLQVSYWVVFPCKMPCPWQCNINILRAFLTLLCCWSGMELNFMFLLQFLCVPFTASAVNSTTSRSLMLLDQASGIRCSNVLASPEQMEKLAVLSFCSEVWRPFSSFSPVSIPFYHSGLF